MREDACRPGISDLESALAELRRMFRENSRKSLERFDLLVKDIEAGTSVCEAIEEMTRTWHRFKGSGGTVGFGCVSLIARVMESAFKDYTVSRSTDLARIVRLQRKATDVFSRIIELDASQDLSSEEQDRLQRDFSDFAGQLGFHTESDRQTR